MFRVEIRCLLLVTTALLATSACAAEVATEAELGEEAGDGEYATDEVGVTSQALRTCTRNADGGSTCHWGRHAQNWYPLAPTLSSPNGCVFQFDYGTNYGIMYSKAKPANLQSFVQNCPVYATLIVAYPTQPAPTLLTAYPDGWSRSVEDWSIATAQPGYGGVTFGAHVRVLNPNNRASDLHIFSAL